MSLRERKKCSFNSGEGSDRTRRCSVKARVHLAIGLGPLGFCLGLELRPNFSLIDRSNPWCLWLFNCDFPLLLFSPWSPDLSFVFISLHSRTHRAIEREPVREGEQKPAMQQRRGSTATAMIGAELERWRQRDRTGLGSAAAGRRAAQKEQWAADGATTAKARAGSRRWLGSSS